MSVDYQDTKQAIIENTYTRDQLMEAYAHGQDDAEQGIVHEHNPWQNYHEYVRHAYESGFKEADPLGRSRAGVWLNGQ